MSGELHLTPLITASEMVCWQQRKAPSKSPQYSLVWHAQSHSAAAPGRTAIAEQALPHPLPFTLMQTQVPLVYIPAQRSASAGSTTAGHQFTHVHHLLVAVVGAHARKLRAVALPRGRVVRRGLQRVEPAHAAAALPAAATAVGTAAAGYQAVELLPCCAPATPAAGCTACQPLLWLLPLGVAAAGAAAARWAATKKICLEMLLSWCARDGAPRSSCPAGRCWGGAGQGCRCLWGCDTDLKASL